ncbi:MAG: GNAT family N-acetyltransferase [Pseudomonadota bacterium]
MNSGYTIRAAERSDLLALLKLLADDPLGKMREQPADPIPQAYVDAFDTITRDPQQQLVVLAAGAELVGCLQLTFIPGLSRRGMWRSQIESVRIARQQRGQGLGRRLLEWAIEHSRQRGCGLVQLTSDKRRGDAAEFYEALGFTASHEGFKLSLD